jgi:Zn-dependent protease with chaperone function
VPPGIIQARHYDGRTTASREALISLEAANDGVRLHIRLADQEIVVSLALTIIGERVGATNRLLQLPDGATLEILDNLAFDSALALAGALTSESRLRMLEGSWHYGVIALLFVLGGSWGFFRYGVPALATRAIHFIPASADAVVGADGLRLLDQSVFQPTKLNSERQSKLQRLFARILPATAASNSPYRLEFRVGGSMGANALALPSGTVVLTDELERLAQNDDELLGVLAHEAGHLVGRHAMRHLLESSATALLVTGILGDVTVVPNLVAAVPTVLVNTAYSRDLERDADGFAFLWMDRHGIDPQRLGDLLQRLAARSGGDEVGLLASHPSFKERVQAASIRARSTRSNSRDVQ